MFTKEVADALQYYVYRLIDPRSGETFYVGKGKGNRVFKHVKGEPGKEADVLTEKLKRIREIRNDGLEVGHVIHRHGLDEKTAFEVEAALIDVFPEAANAVSGRADDRGLMHAKQIIERYAAKEAQFRHRTVIIKIDRSATNRKNIYEAVRYAWKINPKKAEKAELVLAALHGLIRGVFIADRWLKATMDNFPGTAEDRLGRWGFVGHEAPESIARHYLNHRVPDTTRKRGAANPIQYYPR